MRTRFLLLAMGTLFIGSVPFTSLAQFAGPCSFPFMGPAVLGMRGNMGPYSLTTRGSLDYNMSDGNRIHYVNELTFARASDGRTMEEMINRCYNPQDDSRELRVFVNDPKNRTLLTWVNGPTTTHVAFLRHLPEPTKHTPMHQPSLQTFPKRTPPEQKTEVLGTQTIAGLQAKGTRTTTVIPANTEGNDMPITTYYESWMAVESPHIELKRIEDDPRSGHRVTEVVSLSLSEPDASLFAPPQGYTISEGEPLTPRVQAGRGTQDASSSSTSTTPQQ